VLVIHVPLRVAGRRALEVREVVLVGMAVRAGDPAMSPGADREGMVEGRPLPLIRPVAVLAGGREPRRAVVRVRSAVVVVLVAGEAFGRRPREAPVDVASGALHAGVCAGEREPRQVVVDGGARPLVGGVAVLARRREPGRAMVRVRGAVEVVLMAGRALRRGAREPAAGVASSARKLGVGAGEGEGDRVREAGAESPALPGPRRRGVTGLAPLREAEPVVIGIVGGLVVRQVAPHALRGEAGELPRLRAAVAGLAVEAGMRAEQGKPRARVDAERLAPVRPGLRGMARVALGAHLAAVRVAVAVRAGGRHLREDEASMAVAAPGLGVGRGQREAGALVVEGQRLLERRPAFGGVAGAAVAGEVAVRALRGRWRLGRHEQRGEQEGRQPEAEQECAPVHGPPPLIGAAPAAWQSMQAFPIPL